MIEQFINTIRTNITERDTFDIMVTIDCSSIYLVNSYNVDVTTDIIKETEATIEIDTTDFVLTLDRNYIKASYDEYKNEYEFNYDNGVVITVTII